MKKSWGIITVAALTASLSACGGGADATWSGTTVSDPGKAIDSIDNAWKSHVANATVKVRTTDDSRCYFETTESDGKKLIGEKVLCGPYRQLGSEKTSWDVGKIGAQSADGDAVTIGLSQADPESSPFEPGEPSPNLVPWRPDDKKADLTAKVDEPDAPKMAVGDTVEGAKIPEDAKPVVGQDIATPTGRYTTRFATLPRVGTGNDRKAAPDGGTILVVESSPAAQQDSYQQRPTGTGSTTLSVRAGGKDYPVSLENGGASTAVAISGDGKDVTFAYTYDGLTQTLDATGKRVGTKAAGYYLPVTEGTSPDIKVQVGGTDVNTQGWHASATLRGLMLSLSAYDEKRKWAPDGKVWAHLQSRYDEGSTFYKPADSFGADAYDTTPTLKSVTLGGIAASSSSFSETSGLEAAFLLPADPDARSLKLKAVVNSAGPVGGFANSASPATANQTFTFEGTMTLQK